MKEIIKDLIKKRDAALDESRIHKDAIKVLQKICNHEWIYDGHGHNDDYYTCNICGATEER